MITEAQALEIEKRVYAKLFGATPALVEWDHEAGCPCYGCKVQD